MTNVEIQMTNESPMANKKYDIQERVMEFATRVAYFGIKLPKNQVSLEYSKQLIRSSASIGANIEEADGTLTKRDFINKISIGRREARESKYWLINEAREIMLILSSIVNKTKNKI